MSTIKVDTITDEAGTGAPTLSHGVTVAGNLSVDGGTIKLDGNYPVGSQNVALGDVALQSGSLTGSGNVAIGRSSLYSNTSGSENTAVGKGSAENNTAGNYLTAIGRHSLIYNTTGSSNTAVGHSALISNTTATYNTAVGYQAGYSNTTSGLCTYIGGASGKNATGEYNTFVGVSSGEGITTGAKNTILGRYNGNQGGLDIRTSSNNIVLADGDGNPRVWHTGSYLACPTVYSFPVSGRDVYVDSNGTVGYLSSIRQSKTNIVDFTDASWLLNLSPKTFNYRTKDADNNYTDQAEGELYYGLIADEVEAVNSDLCFYNEVDGQQGLAGVSYSKMITPMLKLIQDQQATITALEARITALENA